MLKKKVPPMVLRKKVTDIEFEILKKNKKRDEENFLKLIENC